MNAAIIRRVLRIVALAAMLGAVLWVADHFCGRYHPKTQGWLLGAAAAVFLLGEAFFWKAIEKVSDLPHSDALTGAQAKHLQERIQALKKRLMERWLMLLALKAIAGASAAWLLNQTNAGGMQRLLWAMGVGALAISLPVALTFLRNWQQADAIKSQQLINAKTKKEQKHTLSELNQSAKDALEVAPEILEGYTTTVGKAAKAKTKR
ncbi:MAG: hypothetical protein L0Y58_21700 [Verrucomicrobia subdivision 3 bacterium]|nr:hypothetical protein [Limisphaerales bacterium]